jgi:hypothetical protein
MGFVHRAINAVGGLWELMLIGVRSHLGGRRYWAWRRETAFGNQTANVKNRTISLSARDRLRAMMRFGMWVRRMKRMH